MKAWQHWPLTRCGCHTPVAATEADQILELANLAPTVRWATEQEVWERDEERFIGYSLRQVKPRTGGTH